MNVQVSIEQGKSQAVAVMKVRGEINAENFVEVVNKARELYNNPARNLILDLSEVPAISSTGLVAIHKIALIYSGIPHKVEEDENPDFTHSGNARKHVRLLSPRAEVKEALENAKLNLFFKIYDDFEQALQSF
ncbi:MAG: STAS domain-containing protein [Chloroflexota bacterium]|nr:STAS domain-containing protein [Chloroflexota bacterium]MBI5702171.1 STAS domain-containing protein [Chloroflexota bacterium]